jgi:hypothetical protein
MRNDTGFSVRIRLSDAEGREIHQMALRENRSQSSAISLLLREALSARRAEKMQAAEVQRLAQLLRTPSDLSDAS